MNATSREDLRAALAGKSDGAEDRMAQIRELLVGEQTRLQEARMKALEVRLREIEDLVFRRFEALTGRIDAIARETGADQRAAFEGLSRLVQELGESIRKIPRG